MKADDSKLRATTHVYYSTSTTGIISSLAFEAHDLVPSSFTEIHGATGNFWRRIFRGSNNSYDPSEQS